MLAHKLSVIVATTEPWPEVRACLEALDAEVDAAGGEIVLADGHGAGGPPAAFALRSPLRSAGRAGASVFELRSLALEQAGGEVVAITEDHCLAQPGWARALLDAHAARPDADAVAGPVVNGSPDRLIDWANFLSTFAEFLPPVERRPGFRVPPGSNISYKRRVLPTGRPATGWLEYDLAHRLLREGRLEFDDHPRVAHVQEHGLIGTPLAFFHNGRTTAGLNQERPRQHAARRVARMRLHRRRVRRARRRPGTQPGQAQLASGGAGSSLPAMALAQDFQAVVDSLPPDWTNIELDMRIFDEDHYVEAATLLVQINAMPYSEHDWHWRLRVANTFGHAAAAQTVVGTLGLLDDLGIEGELAVREARSGRVEVVQLWGRPESARQEFRRRRAQ